MLFNIQYIMLIKFLIAFFISDVSENALEMFGSESDPQPSLRQSSTPSQDRREHKSSTSAPETIETMKNSLDTVIPTQVCSLTQLSIQEYTISDTSQIILACIYYLVTQQ